MVSEQLERETKYDAAADYVLPPLDADGGRVGVEAVRLDSVYFDTVDHDLLARGITLRCRTGDVDNGWQLKVPTGGARTEIRLDPAGSHTTVPKELAALVAGTRVAAHCDCPDRPHGRGIRH